MIDRERVARILGDGVLDTGLGFLDSLEASGYRVVPAGLVPQFDDLSEVADILNRLGNWTNATHQPQQAKSAAILIRQLRDLACLVLRVDMESREDRDSE